MRLVGEEAFGVSLAAGSIQRDALIRKLFSGRYGHAPETMRLRTTLRSLSAWFAFREPAYA